MTRSRVGLIAVIFRIFVTVLWPLNDVRMSLYFVSAQYLKNKWTEFDQILYNYLYLQDLSWDC